MSEALAVFKAKAPPLMDQLIDAFGLTVDQAAGIAGNLGHESDGFTELHELGQPADKGGYGWGQWTGPRRVDFFTWCAHNHLTWTEDKANIGFLIYELKNTQKAALTHVKMARSSQEACLAFERFYERAGVVNMYDRYMWTHWALLVYQNLHNGDTK